ncbi:MAG: DUF1844 domain-containing protein [Deltaproteobacteria bacterium]|nr:DUF1844 domain-containing protein [Deltaproteobacteria bacterium]MCL5276424.1 DUF1844 domain-containing protein [Deltaproteobacteria bacterium]
MADREDDNIKVNDKRRFTMDADGEIKDSGERRGDADGGADQMDASASESHYGPDGSGEGHFKIGFADLINSLAGTALIQLGAVADPQTNVIKKDVNAAGQTIDILELLKEKTTGNLTNEESMMLDNVLFDLRMRYVLVSEGKK